MRENLWQTVFLKHLFPDQPPQISAMVPAGGPPDFVALAADKADKALVEYDRRFPSVASAVLTDGSTADAMRAAKIITTNVRSETDTPPVSVASESDPWLKTVSPEDVRSGKAAPGNWGDVLKDAPSEEANLVGWSWGEVSFAGKGSEAAAAEKAKSAEYRAKLQAWLKSIGAKEIVYTRVNTTTGPVTVIQMTPELLVDASAADVLPPDVMIELVKPVAPGHPLT